MEEGQMSTSLEGSGDSIGKKQRKCKLEFKPISELDSQAISKLDEISANSQEAQTFIAENKASISLICSQKQTVKDILNELCNKRKELEDWIKASFEVDDLEQQIYLLNSKRRFSKLSSAEENGSGSRQADEKPKLRLKLTADQKEQQDGPSTGHKGRGSKNLGRMSRPTTTQEAAASTSAPDLKPRVPNQVPIATFWNYVEQFFKRIDENDVKYLDDPNKIVDPTHFTIPSLGKHYLEQWREQYGYSGSGTIGIQALVNGDSQIVSLKDRLLSMLICAKDTFDIHLEQDNDERGDDAVEELNTALERPAYNTSLDVRLRRELVDAGFLDSSLAGKDYQEDDELCVELRRLQSRLCESSTLNQYRKKRLAEHIRTKVLPAQELYALIDEIDRQLCASYAKTVRGRKKTGTKKTTEAVSSQGPDWNRMLANRNKLLSAFGPAVGPRSVYLASGFHEESIFDRNLENGLRERVKQGALWFIGDQQ